MSELPNSDNTVRKKILGNSDAEQTIALSSSGSTPPVSKAPTAAERVGFVHTVGKLNTTPSVPVQDLSTDTLLTTTAHVEIEGKATPMLGGIPLLAKLGQGGMGAVYYGIHPRLNREVAVKVLPVELAQRHPEMIKRFIREARIAASIQSPHLISVTDVNHDGELFYLVMEFVAGSTAGKLVKESGAHGLPEGLVLELCAAVTEGLAAAHAKGVIHRDIKPDNILIPKDPAAVSTNLKFTAAKLADLGLARGSELGLSALTVSHVCMGTPGFMSPEQTSDAASCGKPADIFSMGATMYALLTGKAPFSGTTMMQILIDTTSKPHVPVRQMRSDISTATAEMVDRCLAKSPSDRFADASVMLEAIKICRTAFGQNEIEQQNAVQQLRLLLMRENSQPSASLAESRPAGYPFNTSPKAEKLPSHMSQSNHAVQSGAPPAAPIPPASSGRKLLSALAAILVLSALSWLVFAIRGKAIAPASSSTLTGTVVDSTATATSASPGVASDSVSGKETMLDLGGNVSMELVRVPAGVMTIPTRQVKLPEYYIGKYPVTVAQFRRFVVEQNYVTAAEKSGKGTELLNGNWVDVSGASWKYPGFPQADTHPVVMVTVADAEAFVHWLSHRARKEITLTAEAEWEYAARGTAMQSYPWGNRWDGMRANHADVALKNTGNAPSDVKCSSDNDKFPYTSPVGSFNNVSWCGAYDMCGNVWQWCAHLHGDNRDGGQRGGSWSSPLDQCRAGHGRHEDPESKSSAVGFRIALHLSSQ